MVMARLIPLTEAGREFDREFWARVGAEGRFEAKDIESFLMHALYKEKTAAGASESDAAADVAQALGKKPAEVIKRVK